MIDFLCKDSWSWNPWTTPIARSSTSCGGTAALPSPSSRPRPDSRRQPARDGCDGSKTAIRGYRAIIDPKADGRGLTAFVAVRLVRHQREHIQRFQDSAREVPEIVECHHVTGNFDYLLRVEVPDLPTYENVHADRLAALHNVGQLVTYISMTDFTDP